MKKLIIIACTLLFIAGCGMSNEEKEKMLFDSLEKAYTAVYSTDGAGLAVYGNETLEIDGKNWYQVAISKYDKLSKLEALAEDVFDKDVAKKVKKSMNEKYYETDTALYSISEGGCRLPYDLDDELQSKIKNDVSNIKYKFMGKVSFEYKGKTYTAKKSDDNYVFDDKIFTCEDQEN